MELFGRKWEIKKKKSGEFLIEFALPMTATTE
jgi:hypothetical protein